MEEDELRRLSIEYELLQQQLQEADRQLQAVELSLRDIEAARESMASLSSREPLFPLGGGAYVRARLSSETVLQDVGAGVLVEMEKSRAAEVLAARKAKLEEAFSKLRTRSGEIIARLSEISSVVGGGVH